VEIKLLTS